MNNHNKKIIKIFISIFFATLMFSGAFGSLHVAPYNDSHSNSATPDLSSIGESSPVSIGVNYWTQSSVANSGTTSFDLPYSVNSSQNSIDFSTSNFLLSSTATASESLGSYYYYQSSEIGPIGLVIPLTMYEKTTTSRSGSSTSYYEDVGTVYVNLSYASTSVSWSYAFDADSSISSGDGYITVFPSWFLGNAYQYDFSLSVVVTGYSNPINAFSTSVNQVYTSDVSSNSIVTDTSSTPSQTSVGFVYGWHFDSKTTTFTIPQYESSYDISWSGSPSINPDYNGNSPTGTSGTFTGSLATNSITVNPVGDPPDVSDSQSSYSFSYYLSSQEQVSSASTTQTASPSYTYAQVSGTTNQASASFDFSGSTPSTAVLLVVDEPVDAPDREATSWF